MTPKQKEYQARRQRCINSNLCLRCGNPRTNIELTCTACLAKKSNKRKTVRKDNQAVGLCLCGRPITRGKLCERCHEKYRLEQVRRRKRRKVVGGICPNCGKPANNTIYCAGCTDRATKSTLLKYNNRIISKCCVGCGDLLAGKEEFRCANCSAIHSKRTKDRWHRNRVIVLKHYGSICACCGEHRYEFLEVDHINNDGSQHRLVTGRHIIDWIIRNNFPIDLQILCANCNRGKAIYGQCPHVQSISPAKSKRSQIDRIVRQSVIDHYGGKCTCCGEPNWWFLEFDHINNDGNIHRKQVHIDAGWILQNNYPEYLQLLCRNCNKAKGHYGCCPHTKPV